MAKYPLLLTGLLVTGLAQADCDPATSDLYCGNPFHSNESYEQEQQIRQLKQDAEIQRLGDSVRRQEEQRQESYRRSEPVIVNGPEGSRMYYPNSDGSFYQTYGR